LVPRRASVVVAGVVAVIIVAVGVVIGLDIQLRRVSPSAAAPPGAQPSPTSGRRESPSGAGDLQASFVDLTTTMAGSFGVAMVPVGGAEPPIVLGTWLSGPAWSTIKMPLAIAALRSQHTATTTPAITTAITESDNAAAEQLWRSLGDPLIAASKVEDVLRRAGDPTTVQSQKVRPEYSAFGQTDWSLANQVRFLAFTACEATSSPVLDLMGKITPDQGWGLGTIPSSRFKGGWGPSPTGSYLVRQLGLVNAAGGRVAIAIAAAPASGAYSDGTEDLTHIADWVHSHIASLPSGTCATR